MVIRNFTVGLAILWLAGCDHGDKAAMEASAADGASAVSRGEAVLTEVWQGANPGLTPPGLAGMAAAFDPSFARIGNAANDADDAFIKSTLTFLKAVQTASPALCADAPVARFTAGTLGAIPEDALPAFRAMLTDRLAVIAEGATHNAPPEVLMSGSMQTFSVELGDSPALELLPAVASGTSDDPVAACAATIQGWEALDKTPQSPQQMKALYSGEL